MKISVITVCLNSEKTIERTIKSLIGQTHNNIEYIVIDGNSKDSTVNIIKSYSDYIDYFISEKDEGLYSALNKGIKASTGDIISILHSNDVFYNDDVLKKINNIFEKTILIFYLRQSVIKKTLITQKHTEFTSLDLNLGCLDLVILHHIQVFLQKKKRLIK